MPFRLIHQYSLVGLALFMPSYVTLSQIVTQRHELAWTPVVEMRFGGEEKRVLHFTGASYGVGSKLPTFSTLIKIPRFSAYRVELMNAEYRPLPPAAVRTAAADLTAILPAEPPINAQPATLRKSPVLQVSFIPLRINQGSGQIEMLHSFQLKTMPLGQGDQALRSPRKSSAGTMAGFKDQSVLAGGNWIRIKVQEDGVYRLSYEQLSALGIANPPAVRVYGNGGGMVPKSNQAPRIDDLRENAIMRLNNAVYFYGEGPGTWSYDPDEAFFNRELHQFDDASYYYLTSDLGGGRAVPTDPGAGAANRVAGTYIYRVHHEKDEINLIKSGSEWYGEHFDILTEQTFNFRVPRPVASGTARLKIEAVGRANASTSMTVSASQATLGSLTFNATQLGDYVLPYATTDRDTFQFAAGPEEIAITLQYLKNAPSAEAWLNYLTINTPAVLAMEGDQLSFRDHRTVGAGNTTRFEIGSTPPGTLVWDISVPGRPVQMNASLQGSTLSFTVPTDSLREFIAFNPSSGWLDPITEGEDVGPVPNQNLHGMRDRNYVIVSPPQFLTQARTLAAYRHDHNGLDTAVVTPLQIYHEFSSGSVDAAGIRDFLRMLYLRAGTEASMPRYVLLFGDGSYDNKGKDVNNTNLIPTYQSRNSLSPVRSYVTDDFYGLLDQDEGGSAGLVDIGIGRFPVSSEEQANEILGKTLSYEGAETMGDWRNNLCFIGDDEDGTLHMNQADRLATKVENNHPNFILSKIYLDAYTQVSTPSGPRYPDVNEAINQRMAKGALIVNYTGHGGAKGLAEERILRIDDIMKWENSDRLPLFMTATCEFSRFDEYETPSAGELVLLNPGGGGIALLTTTRLVYAGPNFVLNDKFYDHVFTQDGVGRNYKLGDIIRLTKNDVNEIVNKRNFTLLGDPALELAYPKNQVRLEKITGADTSQALDTIRALSKVTVSGYIEDPGGDPMQDFNGVVYPSVFDKTARITTLANDGGPTMTFSLRNRILYKGKASVNNGRFRFSFIVPKDIAYQYGAGKLSFYASDQLSDAAGAYEKFIIGGSADSVADDRSGPALRIYMNDEQFVNGGMTDPDPTLLVFVSDSNGINTIGSGIGHDITAVLDQEDDQVIVLNDYYEADTDSYKSGKISYPLRELEPGEHNIRIKVWDVYNNSSEESIDFVVNAEEGLVLSHVLNYPNPFTTHTDFFFEHNQPNADLEVLIQVFTVSGKLVKTIDRFIPASGYRSPPISWDGRDDYGDAIGRGVYLYRLRVRSSLGDTAEKYEKLVILN